MVMALERRIIITTIFPIMTTMMTIPSIMTIFPIITTMSMIPPIITTTLIMIMIIMRMKIMKWKKIIIWISYIILIWERMITAMMMIAIM